MIDCGNSLFERREAEFEYIAAAYSSEEAWVVVGNTQNQNQNHDHTVDNNNNTTNNKEQEQEQTQIHRCLLLPISMLPQHHTNHNHNDNNTIKVELILTLPHNYPNDNDNGNDNCNEDDNDNDNGTPAFSSSSVLEIDAYLMNNSSSSNNNNNNKIDSNNTTMNLFYRKIVMDALPSLVHACRTVAKENAQYGESVFVVLSRADEWIDQEWHDIASFYEEKKEEEEEECLSRTTTTTVIISRKLMYSHHIINKNKRRAIQKLANNHELGGYYKIGWPGIIIMEGEETKCNHFIEEIRAMRWQHITVRGEEQQTIHYATTATASTSSVCDLQRKEQIDTHRKFVPIKMIELGEEQMSDLSKICSDVGLRDLFLTSMKIYK